MIQPFHNDCVQPCSYDVHLGPTLLVETEDGFTKVDISDRSEREPLQMPPGAFALGETVEYLDIPNNVEAHLHLVSSRAREGLNHSLAGLVDAGFKGVLTLELKNISIILHLSIISSSIFLSSFCVSFCDLFL